VTAFVAAVTGVGAAVLLCLLVLLLLWLGDRLDRADSGETDIDAYGDPSEEEMQALDEMRCWYCRGSGLRDSGSLQPWGDPILVQCDCPAGKYAASSTNHPRR